MTNLNDVARNAHVSKMTVSRVINHPERVSDELKELVEKAIQDVGYEPNRMAKALVNKRHYVIRFLLLEDVTTVEPNYAKLLIHIANYLQESGYTLEISTDLAASTNNIDGMIVSGWRQVDLEGLSLVTVPIILYGVAPENSRLSYVDVHNKQGIEMATQYMIDRGYQDIWYIGIAIDLPFAKQRALGYRSVMNKYGMSQKVFATDRIALGVVRSLTRIYEVPTDFGVIGFDGVFIDQISSPQLTTIRQPLALIAKNLVKEIVNRVESDEENTKIEVNITPELIIRDSTQ